MIELSLGVALQVFRFLAGSDWRPVLVHLPHEPVTAREEYLRYFSCPPRFADRTAGFTIRTPGQVQTAGSYLYEPGASVHTFVCPETNTEDTVIFVRVVGANINFTQDGQFHSILDAALIRHLTDQLSAGQGLGDINYISGGAAGFTQRA